MEMGTGGWIQGFWKVLPRALGALKLLPACCKGIPKDLPEIQRDLVGPWNNTDCEAWKSRTSGGGEIVNGG